MIAPNPLLGTVLHAIGAASSSACYTPQKQVKGWSWQTYWLTQAAFCWFLLPILGAFGYALYMVAARPLGQTESAAAMAFWGNLCFLLCALALSVT